MRITCPKCREAQTVDEKTAVCPACHTIVRRCTDCTRYDVRTSLCKAVNRPVDSATAWYPTYASESTYCREFAPLKPPIAA